ncbi:sugar MFS transporter [Pseudoduganella lutea]|uniref:Sugar MFS transporter n=1 Tax=Pseudoduganella lutea TaxID=321985 RepID=A0A4P6KS39_9BURK|nr:sugar MFS transporter [Pseudoduganella lutea]QBE61919.1 sugar MFS transporter [Pseudoduganella lutea]
MASIPQPGLAVTEHDGSRSNTPALVIVTLLFFMWGVLTALNDVLIPHLKALYTLSYVQAMLVQFCFFGAYAVVSIPAGALIRRIGYQNGAVAGLVVAAAGCAMFYPAAVSGYGLFLLAFFVLAAGITVLQVAANPYVTVLGDPRTAASRLNLTQAFNSLGTTLAPAVGGMLILSGAVLSADQIAALPAVEQAAYRSQEAALVQGPYLALAAALLLLGILFKMARLPRIAQGAQASGGMLAVLRHRHLLLGAIGIFLYVGAEVSIGSFLINFLGERSVAGLSHADAAYYVSYYWGGAMIGRFVGAAAMRHLSPGRTLAGNAACTVLLLAAAMFGQGSVAMWAVIAVGLFNSIMFPTIFSMALHRLGSATGQASGILCVAIVGGALVPFGQGLVADHAGLHLSFAVPAACYLFILYYGIRYANLHREGTPA